MRAPSARQIGDVAARALLHRLGIAVSVDVALLLVEVARSGTATDAQHRQLAAAKGRLVVMRADATLLQRRVAQFQTEATQWQARAERALRMGEVPLARQALARKLHVEHIAQQYADAQAAQQRALDEVQAAVARLEARLHNVEAVRVAGQRFRPEQASTWAMHDRETVESRFKQFELEQAMDALRRTVQG